MLTQPTLAQVAAAALDTLCTAITRRIIPRESILCTSDSNEFKSIYLMAIVSSFSLSIPRIEATLATS